MFLKRRKLKEIEEKVDRVQQMLEMQMQSVKWMEEQNRQFLCGFLTEKTTYLAGENQNVAEMTKEKLNDLETRMQILGEKTTCEMSKWKVFQENRESEWLDALEKIKNEMAKERESREKTEEQIMEKLDLTENKIHLLLLNSVMAQLPQDMKEETTE